MELKEALEVLARVDEGNSPTEDAFPVYHEVAEALRSVLEEGARQVARIEVLEKALLAIAECRHIPLRFADISEYAAAALLEHP